MEFLLEFLDNRKLEKFVKSNDTSMVYRAIKVMVEIGYPLSNIISDENLVKIHFNDLTDYSEVQYLLKHIKISLVVVDTIVELIEIRMNSSDFRRDDLELLIGILHQIKVKHGMECNKIDELFQCLIKRNLFSSHADWKQMIFHSLLPYFLNPYNESRLHKLLSLNRLDLICALHKHFISKDFYPTGLWSQVQTALLCPLERKNALFILKCRLQLSESPEDDPLFQSLNCTQYNNLIQLLEASHMKQLHLLEPSMHLLHHLNELHLSWQVTAWSVYLSHSHLGVVKATLRALLNDTWWLRNKDSLETILPLILRGFNVNDDLDIYCDFRTILTFIGDQHIDTITQHCDTITWTPISFYYFHKELVRYMRLDGVTIIILLNRLQAVPDKSIRDTFMELHFKPRILEYMGDEKNCARDVMEVFYAVYLHYYNGETVKWLDPIYLRIIHESLEHDFNLLSIYQATTVTYSYLQFLKAIGIDKLDSGDFMKLCRKYLLQCFNQEILHEFDLDTLYKAIIACEPVDKDDKDFSFLLKRNLMNLEANFAKRSVALQIYSSLPHNFQENYDVVLKLWTGMLLSGEYIFDDNTCKAFLKLYSYRCIQEDIITTTILTTQTDSVVIAFFEMIPIDFKASTLELYMKRLLDMKRGNLFKKACDIFFRNVMSSHSSYLLETNSFYVLFKGNLHVRYLVTKKWANEEDHVDERIIKLLFEDCLITGTVRSKKEKMDFNIMMEILDSQYEHAYDKYPLRQWYCYKSQAVVMNSMIICYNSNKSDTWDIIENHLERRVKKRYYLDSQVHLEKIRIYQLLLLIFQSNADAVDMCHIYSVIFKYLCQENNQNDVKQFQMVLLTSLNDDDEVHCFMRNAQNIVGESNSVANFIPILYHMARSGTQQHCADCITAMLKYAMGANFKTRLMSQISILYLLAYAKENKWNILVEKHVNLYNTLKVILADINWNSDMKYLVNFSKSKHYTAESILIDIPRLNGSCEQEWRLYHHLFKEMESGNRKLFCGLPFYNCDRKYSQLDPPIQQTFEKYVVKPTSSITMPNNLIQRKPHNDCFESDGDRTAQVKSKLIVIGSLVESAANLGGLARTCHILGAATLIIQDAQSTKAADFTSLSMSAERWLDIQEVKGDKIKDYLTQIRQEGFVIVGVEQTYLSVPLSEHSFQYKTVLLLGNERTGIPADLLTMVDLCVEIPQHGVIRSLNVHVAAALVVYKYMQDFKIEE